MSLPPDETRLRELWSGPMRFVEITEALNCGHEALRKEAKRLGLPHRHHVNSSSYSSEPPPVPTGNDLEYVARLMAHGGLPQLSEERYAHKNYLLGFGPGARKIAADFYRVVAPLTWPARGVA